MYRYLLVCIMVSFSVFSESVENYIVYRYNNFTEMPWFYWEVQKGSPKIIAISEKRTDATGTVYYRGTGARKYDSIGRCTEYGGHSTSQSVDLNDIYKSDFITNEKYYYNDNNTFPDSSYYIEGNQKVHVKYTYLDTTFKYRNKNRYLVSLEDDNNLYKRKFSIYYRFDTISNKLDTVIVNSTAVYKWKVYYTVDPITNLVHNSTSIKDGITNFICTKEYSEGKLIKHSTQTESSNQSYTFEYNSNGDILFNSRYKDNYHDGFYEYLKYDQFGNWTERVINGTTNIRYIEYYDTPAKVIKKHNIVTYPKDNKNKYIFTYNIAGRCVTEFNKLQIIIKNAHLNTNK